VIADGHKWLNVPYDCGFAFVRDQEYLGPPFRLAAPYLPSDELPGPEASRRARALAVWATLRAYGRSGYRAMVERHLELAQRLSDRVDAEPELERLAETKLNIVCFRVHPLGLREEELDDLNSALGRDVLEDGRVFFGTTRYDGKAAFRPAIVNWRTGEQDVDLIVDVLLELAARKQAGGAGKAGTASTGIASDA
jgi:glutamate/tyrosine decarboxylase-like PLP-dependent enzyme